MPSARDAAAGGAAAPAASPPPLPPPPPPPPPRRLKVAFCHPDLGLGGAERLVVDAAAELAARGHAVDVFTAYYDPARCFEETRSGAFSVTVAGGWFPRSFLGRAMALCAYVRCVLIAVRIAWAAFSSGRAYDVVIVDQVSAAVPALRLLTRARVLFYCHFPDLLLARPASALHALYRAPLDWVEQATTGAADRVLVNSAFTRRVFASTFLRLTRRQIVPDVLYPAVAPPSDAALAAAASGWRAALPPRVAAALEGGRAFVSINRFERKKDVGLALRALAALDALQAADGAAGGAPPAEPARLVVAGGYDARVPENVEHLRELGRLAAELGLRERVVFLPSFSDAQRAALLAAAVGVLYTPRGEHFGIVPLEAMAAGRPVVACNSGGPLESVVNGETGFLRRPTPEEWAGAMRALLAPGAAERMGRAARAHVRARFSRAAFGDRLEEIVLELAGERSKEE
jgi:alpha-1,3/alpha-1,6-mannosyltransferase